MIIDIHTHLGDILNPGGGDLIFQENIRKQIGFDMISFSDFMKTRHPSSRLTELGTQDG